MKKLVLAIFIAFSFTNLSAKDKILYLPISDVLNSKEAKEALDPNIKLSFGSGAKANIIAKNLQANKKTNSVNKSDEEACKWVLLSALKTFQDRAVNEGGTKVVNLTGYFKKQPYDSKDKFQCAVGSIMTGVTLRGDIAK
ncbi:excinuclease ABC subunit A [Campylobacter ureolyticus]|uniref:Excinuclease ABC subunit A n=1 Tax=Campylobacter ureolyticus TaxID=827 RepID=A0A2I1NC38_9BACT|nr:excinuclease ABC subunit A [Campylobacter ureolyticus]MCZ6159430.1 excinuclease ABC subunit A [Campylobacter ureolyticus]MCZ6163665.1 excinuclease ABC subunit A [Campylobacter ureolyticus]MCZ6165253.1 excinuclease ABC subunit A [Campylobacter ureolyticus]PKZ29949.1 excinuclease ABC subunit A [Campylobacter ureolyticus]